MEKLNKFEKRMKIENLFHTRLNDVNIDQHFEKIQRK